MISEVTNEDCMVMMARYPDKFFDLACVDVPYGIGEDGSNNHSRGLLAVSKDYKPYSGNDIQTPQKEYWDELFRVSKNQIVWGANHFISLLPYDSSCWIVWDKMNGETDFADCELAWTSFESAVRIFRFRWQGMLQGNMKNKQERIHPNEKPFQLYQYCFANYSKPGHKILDTHLGSGSSRLAAYKAEIDFYGCDIDDFYFNKQDIRFRELINEPLFQTTPEPEQTSLFP